MSQLALLVLAPCASARVSTISVLEAATPYETKQKGLGEKEA